METVFAPQTESQQEPSLAPVLHMNASQHQFQRYLKTKTNKWESALTGYDNKTALTVCCFDNEAWLQLLVDERRKSYVILRCILSREKVYAASKARSIRNVRHKLPVCVCVCVCFFVLFS